jgi:uncharacterized Zn-binding protein involved in type VI secretion
MPGFILTRGATVLCAHGGQAQPTSASARVLVTGQPVVTLGDSYMIAGCAVPPTPPPGPCLTGQFTAAAGRVIVEGRPVLLQNSASLCMPSGTPLLVVATQQRVIAR